MKLPPGFWFFGGLLFLFYLLVCSEARGQEKIRLSHSALESSNSVWYLAQDRGFYKKNGLDVDLIFIPSTTTSVSSLLAGDVQVGNASGGGVASAVVAGADLVMVSCYLNSLRAGSARVDQIGGRSERKKHRHQPGRQRVRRGGARTDQRIGARTR